MLLADDRPRCFGIGLQAGCEGVVDANQRAGFPCFPLNNAAGESVESVLFDSLGHGTNVIPYSRMSSPNLKVMNVFIAWDGDHIGRQVGRASLADDAEGLRRISQSIDLGNAVWKSWVESHGGSIVSMGGDEGRAEIPADYLDELPKIRDQYAGAVGSSVSVGIGNKLSEADRALVAAKLRGGDRIEFYTDEVNKLVEEARAKGEQTEEQKIADEYLTVGEIQKKFELTGHYSPKSDANVVYDMSIIDMVKAAPAMHPGAFAGPQRPSAATVDKPTPIQGDHSAAAVAAAEQEASGVSPELTHAGRDFASEFHDAARSQEREDTEHEAAKTKNLDDVKKKIVVALTMLKQQAPAMEQVKQAMPDAYQAMMALAQAVIQLSQQLAPPQSMAKAEVIVKPSRAKDAMKDPRGLHVYRVQGINDRGPYSLEGPSGAAHMHWGIPAERTTTEGASQHGLVKPTVGNVQPGPILDFDNHDWNFLTHNQKQVLRFGFESPEHARAWFGPEALERMAQQGYHLQRVPAQRIWRSKSGRQVVYLPNETTEGFGKSEGDKCSACGGPYHEATGHVHSDKTRLCGTCAKDYKNWVKGHTNGRWGGVKFYDHAATSIKGEETKKAENPRDLMVNAVRGVLSRDLLKPSHKDSPEKATGNSCTAGHCYAASEALHYMLGGKEAGWDPQVVHHEGGTHWYLKNRHSGRIIDPTADQFATPVPYHLGRTQAWVRHPSMQDIPSKRASQIIERVLSNGPMVGLVKRELIPEEESEGESEHIESMEKMAIADIKAGRKGKSPEPWVDSWNYTHVLPPEHQKAGYTLHVERRHEAPNSLAAVLRTKKSAKRTGMNRTHVGFIGATMPSHDTLEIKNAHIEPDHRGRGLGVPMYEALYAHAKHRLGLKQVVGKEHSTSANRVHLALSNKHGLGYKPAVDTGNRPEEPFDGRYYGYSYALKAELKAEHDPEDKYDAAGDGDLEKSGLPMPGTTHGHHLNLPVGSTVGNKVKVQHSDGKKGWVQVGSGEIMSQDPSGHPISSRNPGGK